MTLGLAATFPAVEMQMKGVGEQLPFTSITQKVGKAEI